MSTPDQTPAPRTDADLAGILFAPGKGHHVLPVTHKALEGDDEAARAFLGLPSKQAPADESEE